MNCRKVDYASLSSYIFIVRSKYKVVCGIGIVRDEEERSGCSRICIQPQGIANKNRVVI